MNIYINAWLPTSSRFLQLWISINFCNWICCSSVYYTWMIMQAGLIWKSIEILLLDFPDNIFLLEGREMQALYYCLENTLLELIYYTLIEYLSEIINKCHMQSCASLVARKQKLFHLNSNQRKACCRSPFADSNVEQISPIRYEQTGLEKISYLLK